MKCYKLKIIKNKNLKNFIVWFIYYIKIEKVNNKEKNTIIFLNTLQEELKQGKKVKIVIKFVWNKFIF